MNLYQRTGVRRFLTSMWQFDSKRPSLFPFWFGKEKEITWNYSTPSFRVCYNSFRCSQVWFRVEVRIANARVECRFPGWYFTHLQNLIWNYLQYFFDRRCRGPNFILWVFVSLGNLPKKKPFPETQAWKASHVSLAWMTLKRQQTARFECSNTVSIIAGLLIYVRVVRHSLSSSLHWTRRFELQALCF